MRAPMHASQQARYLFLHGGHSIANPYIYLLKSVPLTLIHGRQPYTMLFISYTGHNNPALEGAARVILFHAAEQIG